MVKASSAVPSPPRMHCIASPLGSPRGGEGDGWGIAPPLGSLVMFDIDCKSDMLSEGARTPSTYGDATAWEGVPSGGDDAKIEASCKGAQLECDDGQVAAMPGASWGSGVGIVANTLPRPPEGASEERRLRGAEEELVGALPRPPEAKGGGESDAGENDKGQSADDQARSALGAQSGKQQMEHTNGTLGLGCLVGNLKTADEGASSERGRSESSRDEGQDVEDQAPAAVVAQSGAQLGRPLGPDAQDVRHSPGGSLARTDEGASVKRNRRRGSQNGSTLGKVVWLEIHRVDIDKAGAGAGLESARRGECKGESAMFGTRPPKQLAGYGGRPPEWMSPYLMQVWYVIAWYHISLRPAVAQVVYLAETDAVQGIGLIELAQKAIDEGRLSDADIEQLEQLDAGTQLLSGDELALLRSWGQGPYHVTSGWLTWRSGWHVGAAARSGLSIRPTPVSLWVGCLVASAPWPMTVSGIGYCMSALVAHLSPC